MAGSYESHQSQWTSQGLRIRAATLLLDNQNEGAPTVQGAQVWKDNFGITTGYVLADPNYAMVPGSSVGTPQITIVDPRTMKVLLVQEGWGGDYPSQLTQLAQQNKVP